MGVKNVFPHRFRHTFATWAIDSGAREIDEHNVGMIDPQTGAIIEFPTPTLGSGPFGIDSGFGSIWFAEGGVEQLGELKP